MKKLGILLLCFLMCCPWSALAELTPLPLDQTVHGTTPNPDGWISENEYQDESIHMVMEMKKVKPKTSDGSVMCRYVRIKIADPSQIRTTMSYENYDDTRLAKAVSMARQVEAVAACNADFMKYYYKIGYVIRQGVFYRDALDGTRDVLVIDDKGDFSVVVKATSEMMQAHLDEMAAAGRNPVNTFSFGPVLVRDGEVQEIYAPKFEGHLATQRMAIAQLGDLEYGIIEIDGGNGKGMRLIDVAEFIVEVFPECRIAYNLDGGGSTHLIINGKHVHQTPSSRFISDLIYFASIAPEK